VLVIGASGGCGAAGVQLARAMGLGEIVGVCSARNAEFVQSLGATKIVDYATHPKLIDALERGSFDCVYDTATNSGAGEDYAAVSLELIKPDRKVVAINGSAGMWMKWAFGIQRLTDAQHALVVTDHSRTDLDAILDLMLPNRKVDPQGAQLAFVPVIDQVFPFTPAGMDQAFAKLQSRRARGKIVFDLDQRQ
jgi:NADPH:quinone reductase-like Zn-dependent oxidoreductase